MTPERVQLRRTKGWRKPPNTVVVARPSKWGNPFRAVRISGWPSWAGAAPWRVETPDGKAWPVPYPTKPIIFANRQEANASARQLAAAAAVELFRLHIGPMGNYEVPDEWFEPLRGKNLACWCPLDQPCHAEILLELANR